MGWLGWIIVGAIAGWASGYALKRDTKFDVGDVLVGIGGAIIGPILFYLVGFRAIGLIAELVVAFIGAIIVTIVWEKYLR